MYVSHPLLKPDAIEEREYQKNILETALRRNTLCVLPTGLGKTNIAIMLAAQRLEDYPDKKILVMAPTKPLCAQHQKSFQNAFDIPSKEIFLVTGQVQPADRKEIYSRFKIIVATPQTIWNDIKNHLINLNDFCLLVLDETHRSVGDYAYTYVAEAYKRVPEGRILGLTASPGSDKAKINGICKALGIEAVEIRTDSDEDVKPYIKQLNMEWVKVELPFFLKEAQQCFKLAIRNRISKLKEWEVHISTKKDMIEVQKKTITRIKTERRPILFQILMTTTEAIKIWHLLELLETQSMKAVKTYLAKIKEGKTASEKRLLHDSHVKMGIGYIEKHEGEHPKIEKISEIVSENLKQNKDYAIIVFSHYRDNIEKLHEVLSKAEGCRPVILIGQSGEKGLTQKEQVEILRDFAAGIYNCLITSPIGEEGLHIAAADLAIFYESVASEIRNIQRRGRVARTKVGKVIFLQTKDTRDESYYYAAQRKERKMKEVLKEMQQNREGQTNIEKFV